MSIIMMTMPRLMMRDVGRSNGTIFFLATTIDTGESNNTQNNLNANDVDDYHNDTITMSANQCLLDSMSQEGTIWTILGKILTIYHMENPTHQEQPKLLQQ